MDDFEVPRDYENAPVVANHLARSSALLPYGPIVEGRPALKARCLRRCDRSVDAAAPDTKCLRCAVTGHRRSQMRQIHQNMVHRLNCGSGPAKVASIPCGSRRAGPAPPQMKGGAVAPPLFGAVKLLVNSWPAISEGRSIHIFPEGVKDQPQLGLIWEGFKLLQNDRNESLRHRKFGRILDWGKRCLD